MEIVSSVVDKLSDYLFDAGSRKLGYVRHYNDNIEKLRKEVGKLVNMKDRVKGRIAAAERNGEIIETDVKKWITDADNINEDAKKFLDHEIKANQRCLKGCCINLRTRYKFSKEAHEKAKAISQLQDEGKFESVSRPAHPPGFISSSKRFSGAFESRKSIMKLIIAALNDDSVNIIGICGMGGVGKTTMVKDIGKQVKEDTLYDEVVMAVVSQSPSIMKIQGEIASMLYLTLPDGVESIRASLLWERIKSKQRVLVILDDVWKRIELDTIGIPYGDNHRGCKILFTSRSEDVCNEMDAHRTFKVETLSKEESWVLFKEAAGENVENSDINPIARKIAAKCGGLPIAILTLARALRKKGKTVWADAVRQLEKSNPTSIIGGMQENVFSSLELSYNYLESEEAKSFFLLCCLFPEDYSISVDLLMRYAIGLRLFKDVDTLDDARCRADATVSILSSSFLLIVNNASGEFKQYGAVETYVKMHDIIRDVALKIASKDEHKFMVKAGIGLSEWPNTNTFEDLKVISLMSNDIHELRDGSEYPKLQALLLQKNAPLVVDKNFFQGMKDLKVLDLSCTKIGSIPPSLSFLTNLKTLHLDGCQLNDLSIIGKLTNLEILSLLNSDIKEIPKDFDQLIHLRLFDVRVCQQLISISHNVISNLGELEELYIGNSLVSGEREDESIRSNNAVLLELQSLSRLTSLDIFITNPNMLPDDYLPFQNLTSFSIVIGKTCFHENPCSCSKSISLSHDMSIPLPNCIRNLIKRTESLCLIEITGSKNILGDLDKDGFNQLKFLSLKGCKQTKNLLNTLEWKPHRALQNLEELVISNIWNLVEICPGPLPVHSFSLIRKLSVSNCNRMLHILPGHLLQRLQNIEVIHACECESVEYVFDLEELRNTATGETKLLSLLKELHLGFLPVMKRIWKGDTQFIDLHNLKSIKLVGCYKLRELFQPDLQQSLICLEDMHISLCDDLEEIFVNIEEEHEEKEIVVWKKDHTMTMTPSLGNLTNIHILDCSALINLFTPSIVKSLVQLKKLEVISCGRMQEIVRVTDMDGVKGASIERIVFPSLHYMGLKYLNSLTSFCPALYTIEFLALETLKITGCCKMKTFSYGDTVTPKLNKVKVENIGDESSWTGDLNITVQQSFNEQKRDDIQQ